MAPLPFMPQLDGLRAIAVGAVLVHHLLKPELLPSLLSPVSWGFAGVRLFFVLSGFLITGILLRARADSDRLEVSRLWVIRQF
jgi:peptidoglycan/LPS O-acetylase OafA/YrhL